VVAWQRGDCGTIAPEVGKGLDAVRDPLGHVVVWALMLRVV
jgi:hypothetical protein